MLQVLSNKFDNFVTDSMSISIIDMLEKINVDEKHAKYLFLSYKCTHEFCHSDIGKLAISNPGQDILIKAPLHILELAKHVFMT